MASHDFPIEAALHALGAELRRRKASARILVVGGANLWLRGLIDRPTMDIDVLAEVGKDGLLLYPDPLPVTLREAAEAVQRALGLPDAL